MKHLLSRFLLSLSPLVAAHPAGSADLKEIFYVPFEGSPEAVIARGQAEPYQFRIDKYVRNILSQVKLKPCIFFIRFIEDYRTFNNFVNSSFLKFRLW